MDNRLFDFDHAGSASAWQIINDDVMGGVSRSDVSITKNNTLLFKGRTSLDNNGGFASVRGDPRKVLDNQAQGLRIRVRGTARTFQLRVRTRHSYVIDSISQQDLSFKAEFEPQTSQWQDLSFTFSEFQAVHKGRLVDPAPVIEAQHISHLGFLLADKRTGVFQLEVADLALRY